jgi:excisionase family DNA binding protein
MPKIATPGRRGKSTDLLTPGEAARALEVTPPTVEKYIKRGLLDPVMSAGGTLRLFRVSEVVAAKKAARLRR